MKKKFFENLNHLITKDFWMVKIWQYFHKSIWVAIFVSFSVFFVSKNMILKVLDGALFFIDFVGYPFTTSKF